MSAYTDKSRLFFLNLPRFSRQIHVQYSIVLFSRQVKKEVSVLDTPSSVSVHECSANPDILNHDARLNDVSPNDASPNDVSCPSCSPPPDGIFFGDPGDKFVPWFTRVAFCPFSTCEDADTVETPESELFSVAAFFPHATKANTAVPTSTEITAFFISPPSFLVHRFRLNIRACPKNYFRNLRDTLWL